MRFGHKSEGKSYRKVNPLLRCPLNKSSFLYNPKREFSSKILKVLHKINNLFNHLSLSQLLTKQSIWIDLDLHFLKMIFYLQDKVKNLSIVTKTHLQIYLQYQQMKMEILSSHQLHKVSKLVFHLHLGKRRNFSIWPQMKHLLSKECTQQTQLYQVQKLLRLIERKFNKEHMLSLVYQMMIWEFKGLIRRNEFSLAITILKKENLWMWMESQVTYNDFVKKKNLH